MKRLIILTLCLAWLTACAPELAQAGKTELSPTLAPTEQAETQNAPEATTEAQAPTATPAPTRTPAPLSGWLTSIPIPELPQLGSASDAEIVARYYEPVPARFYGFVTRYLDKERALDMAIWQVHHFREQLKAGYPLLGGNYRYGLENDQDLADWLADNQPSIVELTPAQSWLTNWTSSTDEQARAALSRYDGIGALRSPNDIGRIFCIYTPQDGALVARVAIMDTSALNDYTGIGGTDGVPLGYRQTPDPLGQPAHWAGEVSGDIWDKLVIGDNAWAIFDERAAGEPCGPYLISP